jgi:hypothetical protein
MVRARPKLKAATREKAEGDFLELQAHDEDGEGGGTGHESAGDAEEHDLRRW